MSAHRYQGGRVGLALTLVAAQSIQPLPLGSMFINTSPSTKSGKMSCGGQEKGKLGHVVRSSGCHRRADCVGSQMPGALRILLSAHPYNFPDLSGLHDYSSLPFLMHVYAFAYVRVVLGVGRRALPHIPANAHPRSHDSF